MSKITSESWHEVLQDLGAIRDYKIMGYSSKIEDYGVLLKNRRLWSSEHESSIKVANILV